MLGIWCKPPFREIAGYADMVETSPSFWWVLGQFIQPTRSLRNDLPIEVKIDIVQRAEVGLELFLKQPYVGTRVPRSVTKAALFLEHVNKWFVAFAQAPQNIPPELGSIDNLKTFLDSFSISLQDELDRIPAFSVTQKGNLDTLRLVAGAIQGYPKQTVDMLDTLIVNEINNAGKCLAFELPTACGFHILRAAEIAVKAYVHAATGKLPEVKNRSWGNYIIELDKAGAHSDLIDMLKVLKAKRNPLMHPKDDLDIDEAVGIFCISQVVIETLVKDVIDHSLGIKFKESLKVLPNL